MRLKPQSEAAIEADLAVHLRFKPQAHSQNPLKRVELPIMITLQSVSTDLRYEPWSFSPRRMKNVVSQFAKASHHCRLKSIKMLQTLYRKRLDFAGSIPDPSQGGLTPDRKLL
jgi:hypothetical protein